MKTFKQLVDDCLPHIKEIFPWDLADEKETDASILIIDIREPHEFTAMHISHSINIPRGILEAACEFNYDETEPALASARNKKVTLVCRSGNRSALAADTLQKMGFTSVQSLKTGLKGWSEYDLPLITNTNGVVDADTADDFFATKLRENQMA